jgi:hypothetical protein
MISANSNPEVGSANKYWDDNCDIDPVAGPLYCEACNIDTGYMYDYLPYKCGQIPITYGMTGRCKPVKSAGGWCYASKQCSPYRTQVGSVYTGLSCGVDQTHTSACTTGNPFCNSVYSDTFNRFCLTQTVGSCIHDTKQPYNQFTMYEDDSCYTMSQLGEAPTDSFCDDYNQCTYGTVTKKCQDEPVDIMGSVTRVPGNCVVNTCDPPSDGKPYFSSQCWRDPAFDSTSHNTAPASVQLVYCDSGGRCRWRKQAGASCTDSKECDPQYACLSSHICGAQSCSADSDCQTKMGANYRCADGLCRYVGTTEFDVVAENGLSKPSDSPFTTSYDYVVNCKDHDTMFKASSSQSMTVVYCKGSCTATTMQTFGDSDQVIAPTVEADLYSALCDKSLISNSAQYETVPMTFMQYQNGQSTGISVTKTILVLARPLSLKMTRCSASSADPLCSMVTRPAIGGTTNPSSSYVIVPNNTHVSSGSDVSEDRRIMCTSAQKTGDAYNTPIYPNTVMDQFGNFDFAVIANWNVEKFYRCVDQFGSVKVGSTLINPAEYIFGLKFTQSQQIFILLILVLGIPTLVLIGSRVGRRQ